MTRTYIQVEESAKRWMKNPEFKTAYDALEDQFALASALIRRLRIVSEERNGFAVRYSL